MKARFLVAVDWVKTHPFTLFLIIALLAMIAVYVFRPANNGVATAPAPSALVTQPSSVAVPIPAGTTVFCLQIDGRGNGHLPMLMGVDGPEIIWNQERTGKNWAMTPSSDETKDVGVLLDGRIYAKMAFLKKWGMTQSCAVKCDQTGWSPADLTPGTIGGEEALVSQFN